MRIGSSVVNLIPASYVIKETIVLKAFLDVNSHWFSEIHVMFAKYVPRDFINNMHRCEV